MAKTYSASVLYLPSPGISAGIYAEDDLPRLNTSRYFTPSGSSGSTMPSFSTTFSRWATQNHVCTTSTYRCRYLPRDDAHVMSPLVRGPDALPVLQRWMPFLKMAPP